MSAFASVLERIDRVLTSILKVVSISLFAALTLILSLNIVNRFIPMTSFHWLDEVVELCFAALVFYGTAAVWMSRSHFSAGDWISSRLPSARLKGLYRLFVELAGLLFIGVFLKYSADLTLKSQEFTAVFQIPKAVLYSCMPISAAVMALYSLARIVAAVGEIAGIVGGTTSD